MCKKSQGGLFKGSEKSRLKVIENLLALQPEYFDLEYDIDKSFLKLVHKKYRRVKLICSYHDFKKTPDNLRSLLARLIRKEFSIYKIATMANSTVDSLRMLNFVREYGKHRDVCGLCMGELGKATRILSPIVNNRLNYVGVDAKQSTAPGQLSLQELFATYYYKNINKKTHVYALLGNPVEQSIGHIFHNHMFKKLQQNAVYLKLQVEKKELSQFFQEAAKLPFKGYSVTMPLKESVIPFLKLMTDAKEIKAVNTILCSKNKLFGFNTDGIGALGSIAAVARVKGKKVVVLGAGGTARAIIYEAIKKGAKVVVLNRTLKQAKAIAKTFGCEAYDLNYAGKFAKDGYDILINATSVGMIGQENIALLPDRTILAGTIVLDMVCKADLTKLLQKAKAKKCACIAGYEAFAMQAAEQILLWFYLPI